MNLVKLCVNPIPLGYQPNAEKTNYIACSPIESNKIYTQNCGKQTCSP